MNSLSKAGLPRSKCARQIRIALQGTEIEIWRRLHIPGDANLGWLHAVFQVAIGWTNSHLHQFRNGDQVISDPAIASNEFEDAPPCVG